MSEMYVANCSQQIQDFQYRLPEKEKLIKQEIGIGRQIVLPYDLSTPDIDSIVEQHAKYGFMNVDDVDRTKNFAGVCYSIDRPVNIEKLQNAIAHNREVLEEQGRRTRLEAAVAINENIAENDRDFQALELSVEEIPTANKDSEVNEKIKVDRRIPEGSIKTQKA